MVRHPAVRLPALRLLLQSTLAAPRTACCHCSCCSCITFRRCCCCPAAPLLSSPLRHSYLSSVFLSRRAAASDATTNAVAAAAAPRSDRVCFAAPGAAAAVFPFGATPAAPPPGLCAAAAATAAGCPLELRTFPPAFLRARAAAFSAGASPAASAAVSATAGEGSAAAGPAASTAVSATAAAAACAASATRHVQQQLLRQHPTIVRRCGSAHCQRHAAGFTAASLTPPLHRSLSPRGRLGAAGFTPAWGPAPYRCTYTLDTPFSLSSSSRSPRLHHSRSGGDAAPLLPFFGCRTLLPAFPLQPPATRAAALGVPAALAAAAPPPVAGGPTPIIAATAPASADASVAYAAATIGLFPLLRCPVARGSSQTDGRRSADAAAASASPVVAVAPAAVAALSTIAAFVRAAGCLTALSAAVYTGSPAATAGAPLGRLAVAAPVAAACGPGVAAFSTTAAAGRPAAGAASPDTACRQLHATAAGSVLPAAGLYTAAFAAMKEELARSSSVSSESQSSGKSTIVYSQRFSQLLFDYLMGLSLTLPLSSSKPLPPFLPPVIAATQQLLLPAPASLSEGSSRGRSVAADATSGAHLHTHQLQRLRSLEAPAAAALLLFVAVLRCRSSLSVPPRSKDATGTAATATSSAATGERGRIPAAGEAAEAADQNTGQYKLPRLLLLHTLAELGAALSLREAQLTPQHLVLLRVALELLQGEERSSARRQRTNSSSSGSNAECEDLLLLQQLREHGGALGAVAADFYELLPLHPAVFAEQLSKEDVKAAAREDEEEVEEDAREKEEEEAATEDQRREYGVAEDFRDPQGVLDDADAGAEAADIEEKDKPQASKHGSGSGAGDSSSSNSSTRTGRPSKEILHEISAALSRLEKSHDVLPTYIGPFLFTLRNSAKKELYVCLKQKDFFVNDPERLLPKEEWRYRIAQQRGWRVILVAAEQAWLQLPSAAAKLQYLERALLQPKPVL